MQSEVVLHGPFNGHVHFRSLEEYLAHFATLVRLTSDVFDGAVCMGNTKPPIRDAAGALIYRNDIVVAAERPAFKPYVAMMVDEKTPPDNIYYARMAGIRHFKIMLSCGVSFGGGVSNWKLLGPHFEVGSAFQMNALVHAEIGGLPRREREAAAIPAIRWFAKNFRAPLSVEHVSTAAMADCVVSLPEHVTATIAPHHLLHTVALLHRLGNFGFCAPVLKYQSDMRRLQEIVLSGHSKFGHGSDSAPHGWRFKEMYPPRPGLFTAPVELQLLAQFFAAHDRLDLMQGFVCDHVVENQGLDHGTRDVCLERRSTRIPRRIGPFVPFGAGQDTMWSFASLLAA